MAGEYKAGREATKQVPVVRREVSSEHAETYKEQRFDGGFKAWSTVAGAWLVQFSIIGPATAFGTTGGFYAKEYLSQYTSSEIDWIGSLQLCLMFTLGLAVGRIFDIGYFHAIAIAGSAVFLFGIFTLSLAKEGQYYQVFLSQGVAMAIGCGIVYVPSSSVVSHHFKQRRALAMSFITSGSALGGFLFSTIFRHFLYGGIGFAWGIRISGFICLACLIVANLLMRTNYPSRSPDPTNTAESTATFPTTTSEEDSPLNHASQPQLQPGSLRFILFLFLNPSYSLTLFVGFLIGLSYFAPFFSIDVFTASPPQSQSISPDIKPWLLGIMTLTSIIGRIAPGLIVDLVNARNVRVASRKVGCLEGNFPVQDVIFIVFGICMGMAGVIALMMPLCTETSTIVVFCLLYGVCQGSATALFIPCVISLSKDISTAGVRVGVATVPLGIALLFGTPIAGAVVEHRGNTPDREQNLDWWAGAAYTGVLLLISSGLLFLIHMMERRKMKRAEGAIGDLGADSRLREGK